MEIKEKYMAYDSENDDIENKSDEKILFDLKSKIYVIRDKKVMLDSDLAKIYGYALKVFNQHIRRNLQKFDENEMFKLSKEEFEANLRSQVVTSSYGGRRYPPNVFTIKGILKLNEIIQNKLDSQTITMIEKIFSDSNENTEITKDMIQDVGFIQNMIIVIRNQQVMLDYDLAQLYGYDVKRLNEQVSRNIERFPEDFMFQLTIEEAKSLPRSQIATLEKQGKGSNVKYAPYVFTELGVYMLSAVLKSEVAVQQSILIARAFKQMRQIIQNVQFTNQSQLFHLNNVVLQYSEKSHQHDQHLKNLDNSIELIRFHLHNIQKSLDENEKTKEKVNTLMHLFEGKEIEKSFTFFKGQVFDADESFQNIYSYAQKSIFIIDNYVSIKTLSLLKCKKENVEVIIFTNNLGRKDKLRKAEVEDFNKQYPALIIKPNSETHDRYIILDYGESYEKVYHLGASVKDTGKKTSSVNELENTNLFHPMIEELLKQDDIELEK